MNLNVKACNFYDAADIVTVQYTEYSREPPASKFSLCTGGANNGNIVFCRMTRHFLPDDSAFFGPKIFHHFSDYCTEFIRHTG